MTNSSDLSANKSCLQRKNQSHLQGSKACRQITVICQQVKLACKGQITVVALQGKSIHWLLAESGRFLSTFNCYSNTKVYANWNKQKRWIHVYWSGFQILQTRFSLWTVFSEWHLITRLKMFEIHSSHLFYIQCVQLV